MPRFSEEAAVLCQLLILTESRGASGHWETGETRTQGWACLPASMSVRTRTLCSCAGPPDGEQEGCLCQGVERGEGGGSTPKGATGLEAQGAEEKFDPDSSAKHGRC